MITPTAQEILKWLLIFVSILLVAGITYVYTNRNRRVTLILTLFSALGIALAKVISIVEGELKGNFLGSYNTENIPYMVVQPGWMLLIHGWHIWILPVLFVIAIASIVISALWNYKKSNPSKIEVAAPLKPAYTFTNAQRLDTFMAIDAAKKEAKDLNKKLSEALLNNAAYEIKIEDLNIHIQTLETHAKETQTHLQEEIETLKLELAAKTRENEYLSEQITERNHDLMRAQEMFEKLAALHRKMQSGEKS